jgi:hypothetical protein
MAPPRPPPPPFEEVVVVESDLLDGLIPNGQYSPPLGGSIQVRELPSLILTKCEEIDIDDVVLTSVTNAAGIRILFVVGQLGPR